MKSSDDLASRMRGIKDQPREIRAAVIITLVYAIISGLWVVYFDRLFFIKASGFASLEFWYLTKWGLFIFFTAGLLYWSLRREFSILFFTRQRIQKERDRFYRLAQTSPVGVLITDGKGIVTYLNSLTVAILGKSYEEVRGRRLDDIFSDCRDFSGEPISKAMCPFQMIQSTLKPVFNKEVCFGDPDSEDAKYVSWNASPFFNEDGNLDGVIMVVEDIREKVMAEKALKLSEYHYRSLVENAPIGVYRTDANGRVLYANPAILRMFGYDHIDEVQNLYTINLYRDPERREELLRTIREKGQVTAFPVDFLTKSGEVVSTLMSGSWVENEVTGMVLDIREIRAAEKALRESEARSSALLNAIPDLMIMMDKDGVFMDYHANLKDLLFLPPEQFLGRKIDEVFTPYLARLTKSKIQQTLETGELTTFRYDLSLDGEDHFFEARMVVLKPGEQVLALVRDITDRILLENAKQDAANEERQRIARDLHDAVSQSLFSASVMAQSLPRLWERNPDLVRQGLDDLARLTRGALAEMRMLLLELRPSALQKMTFADLLHQLGDGLAARRGITIDYTIEDETRLPIDVREGFYRIGQEIMNNINKHARATNVKIHYESNNTFANLTIEDDGVGFDLAENSGGFGLAIMRERANQIGADLDIDTEQGRGTRFTLKWCVPKINTMETV